MGPPNARAASGRIESLALASGRSAGMCLLQRPYNPRLHQAAPRGRCSRASRDEPPVSEEDVGQRSMTTIEYTPGIAYKKSSQYWARFITA